MKPVYQIIGGSLAFSAMLSGAENHFRGEVHMGGSILETPCAIAMDSLDQTIEFDTVPLATLKQWGEGPRYPFVIRVIDCRLNSSFGLVPQKFAMTFDGPSEPYGFSIFGTATGVALRLDDEHGQVVSPGQPLQIGLLHPGDHQLKYGLRVVSNHSPYTPGSFQSIIRFKLNYY
ncbi:fimbrial protein [Providencia sp. Me31A]|uniref:fimbrial protein n=1 Tax=Providencia sp. Me31A TaxID=3392637 RepID=UPI003D2BFB8D